MKRSSLIVLASLVAGSCSVHGADATSTLDYTERNTPFAPGATAQPAKRTPEKNDALQEKRVTPSTIDKQPAAVGDRRAAIDISETRPKTVQEKQTQTLEKIDRERSGFDQQRARVSTADDTNKPPLVAKYQESLVAASASNMARFPAPEKATTAKINRFVFRKNGGELTDAAQRGPVVPAAGGASRVK